MKTDNLKTNAMRILEELGVSYEHTSTGDTTLTDAVLVATKLGLDPNSVFKTLVTVGKTGNHYVFMVPATGKLDLKKAARACGEKNIEMIQQKELFPLTGYVHGGCSPLGMKKKFPTFIEESCILYDRISFSAGKIGEQLRVDPVEFIQKYGVTAAELI